MLRLAMIVVAGSFLFGAGTADAAKVACTYEECAAACQKASGSSNGCPRYCEKALADRRRSGECK